MKISMLNYFLQIQRNLSDALKSGESIDQEIWEFLVESENALIKLMNNNPPRPNDPGNIEFGWALYFLNNDISIIIKDELKKFGNLPNSQITKADWACWEKIWQGAGVLMGDGTLLSTACYAQMDPGWSLSLLCFLLQKVKVIAKQPFAHNPAVLDFSNKESLKIALFGDWGTGEYKDGNLKNSPSQLVMKQIALLKPDIMIHLGDVYYAGLPNEEFKKLLNCWIKAPLGNFTLNSNHEMYDGGNGLYNVALADELFQDQKCTTYFSLKFKQWKILGLDSAYNATKFYMDGVINDPYQPGKDGFISKEANSEKLMILTHHNPIDTQGGNKNSLWEDVVTNSLDSILPDVWYWGHTHNGIVYNEKAASGKTKARCLGHAAIPFGDASWLKGEEKVDYYTNTPLGDGYSNNAKRVKNGFAILDFDANGLLTETWYDQDGEAKIIK
ncbi:hypothetical protein EGI22_12470 [Lacihabitans sp. LS3-19]|uniref:metallophosphoesterase family protein n=1 Tax=Lacihabitans sp. LS3-19 TaxID=2487335 RepID=UPI0020CD32C9|nr:metallophosphoesterase [Lacihabitans sp. LS3-19]MCP9768732.1 hypothetical protein [Lacihabitans sp. LS3-19]